MNIAVTGASGRIGNVVVRQLLEAGHYVRVLQRRESRALAGLPVVCVSGELLDPVALKNLMEGCEAVIHLAAVISVQGGMQGRVQQTNFEGTRILLETAQNQGIRRVICFSSIHAFKQFPPNEILNETRGLAFNSRMAYDRSKAEALDFSLKFAANHPLEVIALCPTSVIGPFDFEPSLSGQMFLDFYRRKIPMLVPGGFDWCDVRDIAAAAVSALEKGRSGEAYLLSGRYATLLAIAQIVGATIQKPTPKFITPYGLLRIGVPFMELYAQITGKRPLFTREALETVREGSKRISCEKAQKELGYTRRSLETTIADTYQWFEQNRYL